MFCDNLVALRRLRGWTQENLAERVGVSRQTVAKWEAGGGLPDLECGRLLAAAFDVSLDNLVNWQPEAGGGLPVPPKGKYIFGAVTVGEKGQIVIPAKARTVFDIRPGERLLVMGDEAQGLTMVKEQDFLRMVEEITAGIQ